MFHLPSRSKALGRIRLLHSSRQNQNVRRADRAWTPLPPVRVLGPTVWCFSAMGIIYLGCAAYEVRQDVKDMKKKRQLNSSTTFDRFDSLGRHARIQRLYSDRQREPGYLALWQVLSEPGKVTATAALLNFGIYGLSTAIPSTYLILGHIPAASRNYTLFTSNFVHAGALHLGANLLALVGFAPRVASSRTIEGSGSHLTAFYLSAGVMSGLASQLTSVWPAKRGRMHVSLGASGAIYGILGAAVMSFPNDQVGLIFLPGVSLPAWQALIGIAIFDTAGLFGAFNFRLGHGAHLGGLLFGLGYVYFDANKHLWTPTRRFAFEWMRQFGLA